MKAKHNDAKKPGLLGMKIKEGFDGSNFAYVFHVASGKCRFNRLPARAWMQVKSDLALPYNEPK